MPQKLDCCLYQLVLWMARITWWMWVIAREICGVWLNNEDNGGRCITVAEAHNRGTAVYMKWASTCVGGGSFKSSVGHIWEQGGEKQMAGASSMGSRWRERESSRSVSNLDVSTQCHNVLQNFDILLQGVIPWIWWSPIMTLYGVPLFPGGDIVLKLLQDCRCPCIWS